MSALNLRQTDPRVSDLKAKLKAAEAEAARKADQIALAVGHAVLAEAKASSEFETALRPVLDRRIRPKRTRVTLGLDEQQPGHQADAPAHAGAASSLWNGAQASKSNP